MSLGNLIKKICRRIRGVFVKPIRVFCFHQVSDEYDPLVSAVTDWTSSEQFKKNILKIKKKYNFITLEEAHKRLCEKRIRFKKYAVLTADDGYLSVLSIIPWLEEQRVPITLFVNTKYLDKKSWGEVNERVAKEHNPDVDMLSEVCPKLFLSKDQLFEMCSPFVTIGLHGHEHFDATKLPQADFRRNVEMCQNVLRLHPRYVPFYAYTWGNHNASTDKILYEMGLIPVIVSGSYNCMGGKVIDRICIDGKIL